MKDQELLLTVQYLDDHYTVQGTPFVIEHHLKKLLTDLQVKGVNSQNKEIKIHINQPSPTKINSSVQSEEGETYGKLKEILRDVEPNSEWLLVLTFIYYLTQEQKETLVTAKSLSEIFQTSSLTPPGNIHLSIFQCVNKGFIQLVGTSNSYQTYQITAAGVKSIEDRITYSQNLRSENLEIFYESENQKKQVETFIQQISPTEYETIKNTRDFENKVLLVMYYLTGRGVSKKVRSIMIYQILVQLYRFAEGPRAVQTALSRARPLVMKVKIDNKIHYKLTHEGRKHLENKILIKD